MFNRPWGIWNPHWQNRNNSRVFWYTLITLILAMALPYSVVNQIMGYFGRSVFDPVTEIDRIIPFIGWSFVDRKSGSAGVSIYTIQQLLGLVGIVTKE